MTLNASMLSGMGLGIGHSPVKKLMRGYSERPNASNRISLVIIKPTDVLDDKVN